MISCCTLQVITPPSFTSPTNYYVFDPVTTISIPDFTMLFSSALCGPISCSIQGSLNASTYSSINTTLFTFSGVSPLSLKIQNTFKLDQVGSYDFRVTCIEGSYAIGVAQFNVQVTDKCHNNAISPPVLQTQLVWIGVSVIYTIPPFSSTLPSCGAFTYTYQILSSPVGSNPAFITFNPSTLTFSMSTQSTSNKGNFTVQVTASLLTAYSGQQSGATTFIVQVGNCLGTILFTSKPTLIDKTYFATQSALNYVISPFVVNNTNCTIVYSLKNSDGSACDSSLFTISQTGPTISVFTNVLAKENVYNLLVQADVLYNSAVATSTISVTVVGYCYVSVIQPTAINNFAYDISELTTDIVAVIGWSQSQPSCNTPITYTLQMQNLAPAPSFVSLSGSKAIEVYSTAPSDVGTYNLRIFGNIGAYATHTENFQLKVTDNCPTATLTPPDMAVQLYVLGSVMNLTYDPWLTQYSYCTQFTYSASLISPTLGSLPSFLTFLQQDRVFSIYTTNPADYQAYILTLTAQLCSQTSTQEFRFVVAATADPCYTATVNAPSTVSSPQTYILKSTIKTISIPSMVSTNPPCGTMTYTIKQSLNGGTTYTTIDSAVLTFQNTNPPSLKVYSTDYAKVGSYLFKVSGHIANYYFSNSTTFTLNIVDYCLTTAISTPTVSLKSYIVTNPALAFSVPLFSESQGNCGAFTYTAKVISPLTSPFLGILPSFVTFNPSSLSFSVQTNDLLQMNEDYQINITGTLPSPYPSSSVILSLSMLSCCYLQQFYLPTVASSTVYYVFNPAVSVSIGNFGTYYNTSLCGTLVYTIEMKFGAGSFGVFNTSMFTFASTTPMSLITVPSGLTLSQIGTYTFKVTGTEGVFGSSPLQFQVSVQDRCAPNLIVPPSGFSTTVLSGFPYNSFIINH